MPLSSDPSDVRALTVSHFIIGVPLLEIPERENSSNLTLLSRWTLIQQMKQEFWKRWSRDYLHHLQIRPKWITPRADLKIGDLVVIHDPQAPPLQWKLGRINCTHPGPDLRVRVISIRTQDGEIQRPISKVILLLPAGENVQVSQDYNSKSCRQRVTTENRNWGLLKGTALKNSVIH
ncbi:integrase catalytic domain-containing protein [Trichonephila clavipes]|uniref:Integrase catalytic domain-containing protein n=1 Tax=Trichonephila clavipes TaxID=2585209 RepID=A0A8X6RWX3_TRICX|nr:integrase catalytic domain-containing protein [Trichonephila clavipes]